VVSAKQALGRLGGASASTTSGTGGPSKRQDKVKTWVIHLHAEGRGEQDFTPEPYHISVPGFACGGPIASLIDCHSTGTADGVATARGEVVAARMPEGLERRGQAAQR
jgi:hypothetical protein